MELEEKIENYGIILTSDYAKDTLTISFQGRIAILDYRQSRPLDDQARIDAFRDILNDCSVIVYGETFDGLIEYLIDLGHEQKDVYEDWEDKQKKGYYEKEESPLRQGLASWKYDWEITKKMQYVLGDIFEEVSKVS